MDMGLHIPNDRKERSEDIASFLPFFRINVFYERFNFQNYLSIDMNFNYNRNKHLMGYPIISQHLEYNYTHAIA